MNVSWLMLAIQDVPEEKIPVFSKNSPLNVFKLGVWGIWTGRYANPWSTTLGQEKKIVCLKAHVRVCEIGRFGQ